MSLDFGSADRLEKQNFEKKTTLDIAKDLIGREMIAPDLTIANVQKITRDSLVTLKITGVIIYNEDSIETEENLNSRLKTVLRDKYQPGDIFSVYSSGKPITGVKIGEKKNALNPGDGTCIVFDKVEILDGKGNTMETLNNQSEVSKKLGWKKDSIIDTANIFSSKFIYILGEKTELPGQFKSKTEKVSDTKGERIITRKLWKE